MATVFMPAVYEPYRSLNVFWDKVHTEYCVVDTIEATRLLCYIRWRVIVLPSKCRQIEENP